MCIVVNGENFGQLCNTATANEKITSRPAWGKPHLAHFCNLLLEKVDPLSYVLGASILGMGHASL